MKKKHDALPALADRLELPEEALTGAGKLTVTAGRRALIENHKGILEYSPERISVSFGRESLNFYGQELRIVAMNRRELLIAGKLQEIAWSGL